MQIAAASGITYSCGGSLIAPRVILSAAHCNDPYEDATDERGYVGATNFWSTDNGAVLGECLEWKNHPDYIEGEYTDEGFIVPGTTVLGGNDFALCLLPEDIDIDQSQVFLELNEDPAVPVTSDVTESMGMGRTSGDRVQGTNVLLRADLPMYSQSLCNFIYFGDIDGTMLCTNDSGSDRSGVCSGDSGGPIVVASVEPDGRTKHTQVGVVSWGAGLCGTFPDVHARVSVGMDWIKPTVCDEWGVDAPFCDGGGDSSSPTASPVCEDGTDTLTVLGSGGRTYTGTCVDVADYLVGKRPNAKTKICSRSTTAGSTLNEECPVTCGVCP